MSENPGPDLDRVRDALRRHDDRTTEPEEPAEGVPEPPPEDEPEDDDS